MARYLIRVEVVETWIREVEAESQEAAEELWHLGSVPCKEEGWTFCDFYYGKVEIQEQEDS